MISSTTYRTKKFLLLFFSFIISFSAKAQLDTIYMTSGVRFTAKVLDFDMNILTYANPDSISKLKRVLIPKSSVRLIVYSTGIIKIGNIRNAAPIVDNNMFLKGATDAQKYYVNGGGSVAVGVVSFFTGGIGGLIPAIACSATTPKYVNLGIPRDAPVKNKDYILGYTAKAKKMKQKKVWLAFGLGVAAAGIVHVAFTN